MTDQQIDAAFQELEAANILGPLSSGDLIDFYMSMTSESDRGLAIVSFANVDDILRSVYLKVLNPDIDGGVANLVGPLGPLGSAGLRIHMAYALHWIEQRTYRALRAMQQIRNAFAHSVATATFDTESIKKLVDAMPPLEDIYYESGGGTDDTGRLLSKAQLSYRLRFHIRSAFASSLLIMEMTGAPFTIPKGLPPHAALSRGFDRMTSLHQNAALAAVEVTTRLLAANQSSAGGADDYAP